MIKRLFCLGLLLAGSLSAKLPEKIYLDLKDVDFSEDRIYIHLGHNEWMESNTMYADEQGIFTMNSNIVCKSNVREKYEKTWKCPYCFRHWPVGKPCGNADCPSKYR